MSVLYKCICVGQAMCARSLALAMVSPFPPHFATMLQGAPFNIKDFKVLLDKQVYEGLEGRWVDLFNRMKWDIIKSVLKSVAGLQGRKFKVPGPPPCTPLCSLTVTQARGSVLAES